MRRSPGSLFLLRALSLALASVFALPSCMTVQLWSDRDRWHAIPVAEDPEFAAWLEFPEHQEVHVLLELPAKVAGRLHELVPSLPASARWVRVVAKGSWQQEGSLGGLLAIQAARRPHWWPTVRLTTEPGTLPRATFHMDWFSIPPDGAQLQGIEWRAAGWYKVYFLDVPCEFVPLDQPPEARGIPLAPFGIERFAPTADGMPVATKLGWTPLAVAGDILLSPFELMFLLAH